MPHLILGFSAEREMVEKFMKNGSTKVVPTGKQTLDFKFIDTDKGEVTEFSADATNIKHEVRAPNYAEMHTATQVLNRDPGETIALKQFEEVTAERDSYRQKHLAAQSQINTQSRVVEDLKRTNQELMLDKLDASEKALIGDALDVKIMELAAVQDYDGYEKAKKLYRRMTGHGWADDDQEVD